MSKEYNVLILGPKSSGKTVYLSSMYYELSMPNEYNFWIESLQSEQGGILKEVYKNLPEGWPPPNRTDKISEWKFRCMLKNGSYEHEIFRITYFDYSGGRLLDYSKGREEVEAMIDKSDILLGMIDGHQLSTALKDNDFTSNFYLEKLEAVINPLAIHHKEGKIVHLLITKWDILKNTHSLLDVQEALLKFPRFKRFASNIIGNGGKIRLIPISSVGFDFAELAEDGVTMKVKNGANLLPYNVDLPIGLALLDPIKTSLEDAEKKARELEQKQPHVDPNLSWWQRLLRGAGYLVSVIVEKRGISNEFLKRIADWARTAGEEKIEYARKEEARLQEELKSDKSRIKNMQEATEYVIKSFFADELKLEREHPGSLIDKKIL